MRKFLAKYKKEVLIGVIIVFLLILFFSYNITTTWDSSEYLGLADYIGTDKMQDKWIGHRGIAFPFLLKLFKPFGIENTVFLLILTFIFYISMVITTYIIYKKLKEIGYLKSKVRKIIFIVYSIFLIVLNPIIFGYYHTILTEFVAMTIALVMCYLTWKWIDYDWKENKKQSIIYAIIFAFLTVFMYHIKQSLVPLTIIPVLIVAFISIINNFKLKNILTKISTVIFIIVILIGSIKVWNSSMKKAEVRETTATKRVNGHLISGITRLKRICDETTIDNVELDIEKMSNKDNEEINKILAKESEYKTFDVYQNLDKDRYLVYFGKGTYSFKEDLKFYIKTLITEPSAILNSYYNGYKRIVFCREDMPLWLGRENFEIPIRIYLNEENVVDINIDYEQYIKNYRSINQGNIVSIVFNKYALSVFFPITAFTKISLWILPITWIISLGIYCIFNKKISFINLKVLQLVVILYTTSFGGIMSYIAFGAFVDRYVVPMMITTFIGHLLSVFLMVDFIKRWKV